VDALALAPSSHAALLTRASAALAAAETLPDLAALIDQAEVVRVAVRKARLGREAQNEWAAFRLEAVRKAGRTLASMRAAGLLASRHGGDRRSINATLIEHLGAPSHQAAWERANRWQRLAAWPETAYQTWVATMRAYRMRRLPRLLPCAARRALASPGCSSRKRRSGSRLGRSSTGRSRLSEPSTSTPAPTPAAMCPRRRTSLSRTTAYLPPGMAACS
jgi:hypothetical protein